MAADLIPAGKPTAKCCLCDGDVVFDDEGNVMNATLKNKKRFQEKGALACYVCCACNCLSSRIDRIKKAVPSLSCAMEGWGKGEKQAFMARNHDVMGEELQSILTETITQAVQDEDFNNFKGSSNWLDSPDLKIKYKGKEQQMQNIKDNARSFDHPTRKVKLYEDIEFSGEMGMSNKRKNVRELELQTEERKKKKTRQARPRREREAGPREPQARLLAPSAKTRLEKALAVNKKQYDLLQTAIAHAQDPKYMGSIANKVLAAAVKCAGETKVSQTEVETVLEEGWMGASVKPYEEKLKVSTPLTQRSTEQLTQQTADADGLIASETVVVE